MNANTEQALFNLAHAQHELTDALLIEIDEAIRSHVEEHHELTPVRPSSVDDDDPSPARPPPAEPTSWQ